MADCSRHHVFSVDLNLQEGSAPIGTDDDQSSLRAQLERWNRFAPFTNHDFILAGSFHCHAKCHAGIGLFHPLIMISLRWIFSLLCYIYHFPTTNNKLSIFANRGPSQCSIPGRRRLRGGRGGREEGLLL